jgi:hypothetical protein
VVKVKLNKYNEWVELPDDSPDGIYLDGYLKEKLDNVLEIQRKGWDAVMLIDGRERSGKSTLAMTCANYVSKEKFTMNNFAKGIEDAKQKLKSLPDHSWLFIDEGSLVFNSKESRNKENVELQNIMDVVGQKNMIFIVVLPSVFDLTRPLACRRSLFLLHVFVDEKWTRGRFAYYGEEKKEMLYVEGKKNYNKYTIDPEWSGSFTKFEPPFNEEYLKLKQDTLMLTLEGGEKNKNKGEVARLKEELKLIKEKINILVFKPESTQIKRSKQVGINLKTARVWGGISPNGGGQGGILNIS